MKAVIRNRGPVVPHAVRTWNTAVQHELLRRQQAQRAGKDLAKFVVAMVLVLVVVNLLGCAGARVASQTPSAHPVHPSDAIREALCPIDFETVDRSCRLVKED